jgi:hypothetical protein
MDGSYVDSYGNIYQDQPYDSSPILYTLADISEDEIYEAFVQVWDSVVEHIEEVACGKEKLDKCTLICLFPEIRGEIAVILDTLEHEKIIFYKANPGSCLEETDEVYWSTTYSKNYLTKFEIRFLKKNGNMVFDFEEAKSLASRSRRVKHDIKSPDVAPVKPQVVVPDVAPVKPQVVAPVKTRKSWFQAMTRMFRRT